MVDFRFDLLALPRCLGETVDRPAERARRRLVAGEDEGDDVVLDLLGRQSPRTFCAQEQRQEVLRHAIRITRHAFPSHLHRVGHDLAEIGQGLPAPDPREAWQPVRRTNKVERVDAPHRLEKPRCLSFEPDRVSGDLTRKQRFGEDVVGQVRHVVGKIHRPAVLVAGRENPCSFEHGPGKAKDVAWREHRCHRLARPLPHLAFRRQQAVAQHREQHFLPDYGHAVVLRIVHEHVAYEARIVGDHDRAPTHAGSRCPAFVEGRLLPQLKRIDVGDPNHLQRRRRTFSRRRCGGDEGRRLGFHEESPELD